MPKPNGISAWAASAHRPLTPHEQTVRALSDRLVEAQRPIRILDAVRWDDDVERTFFARHARELPDVTPDYYGRRPLAFDPPTKLQELRELEDDIGRRLGSEDAAGLIMTRMCREYRQAVRMLAQRGTPEFADISSRLYGRSTERLEPDGPSLADLSAQLRPPPETSDAADEPTLDSGEAVEVLAWRLRRYFQNGVEVRVRLSDEIVADAAAGGDYLKLRRDARFTPRDLRLLEVHEGWVHLGTTLNGQRQPVCRFLSKGSPSSTLTQEGLAVLTELLAGASHPARARRLALRVRGVALAEAGANFLEVYRSCLGEGVEPRESYQLAARVFRGSLPEGCGPFTKDLCYGRGFLLVLGQVRKALADEPGNGTPQVQHFGVRHPLPLWMAFDPKAATDAALQSSQRKESKAAMDAALHRAARTAPGGFARLAPLLFCGKTALADLPLLKDLAGRGFIEPPHYVPPPFADASALRALLDRLESDPTPHPSEGGPVPPGLAA
jgi:uncharacterized protein (TIGR02421 family)